MPGYDTPRRLTRRGMIPRGVRFLDLKFEKLSEFLTKIENILTRWSVAQAGLNYEKTRWTVPLKIKLCLKGEYRDLFKVKQPIWACEQLVKIFLVLVKIALGYSNFKCTDTKIFRPVAQEPILYGFCGNIHLQL